MRQLLVSLAAVMLAAAAASAQSESSTIWSSTAEGAIDSGWVVISPTGPSDYFSVAYAAVTALNVENGTVSKAMPIKGVGVSVADFGTTQTYPTVGVFRPNPTLD